VGGSKFSSALYGDPQGPSGIKFWQLYLGPFLIKKNSEILTKIDDFSSYVKVAKLKKVVYMRADAPHKWSKVQPRALIGEKLMAKKPTFPAWANAFQGNTKNGVGNTNSSTATTRQLSYRCRRQTRPSTTTSMSLLTTRSTCRGEIFRSLGQSPRGKYPSLCRYQISLQHSVGYVEGNLPAKTQLDSSSRFDTIPACGGQTNGQTEGHTTTKYTALGWRRAVKMFLKTERPTRTCAHVRRDRSKAGCRLQ